MANLNPLDIRLTKVIMTKFNGSDEIDISPQFVETSIYQSIFKPYIEGEMLINDQIGLFVNYPLLGEELITIYYEQLQGAPDFRSSEKKISFIIKNVRRIISSDRARSYMYVLDLVSPYFLQNLKKYVSHAYADLLEDAAEKLFNEYIGDPTYEKYKIRKYINKETSNIVKKMIVPNLRPFQAMQWLAKHAIPADTENHYLYLFYEDLTQFNFLTMQKLIEDAAGTDKKRDALRRKKYVFISDIVSTSEISQDPDQDLRVITNIATNKRFSSLEKIMGGYFQNELFEINLLQKSYNSTKTELNPTKNDKYALEPYPTNTYDYIDYMQNKGEEAEISNRIRYIINNYENESVDDRKQPSYRDKFGKATIYMHALNQVDLSITVPANMSIKAGDVIHCDLPESHGFNSVDFDYYISGLFLVAEVKQTLSLGNLAATSLRIYKDGYLNQIEPVSRYKRGVGGER
jgi:hypothetical protein